MVDIENAKVLARELEKELDEVLQEHYKKSPYLKHEVAYHVYTWGYEMRVGILLPGLIFSREEHVTEHQPV